ncbi:c-type cytochrome [Paracandidimonas soli]|uniref:Cytochrome c n=1 Tax=Paracandidimonas soli TaxID=1917182 RepID=A0A4R3V4D3_9BURK|nr:cytochrome c [Paracandidimonas soli]
MSKSRRCFPIVVRCAFVLLAMPAALPVQADALALAQSKACLACHTVERKLIGPAFKDVAAKEAGAEDAAQRLADHIRKGSSGVWGPIPMPPNGAVSEADAKILAEWILSLK